MLHYSPEPSEPSTRSTGATPPERRPRPGQPSSPSPARSAAPDAATGTPAPLPRSGVLRPVDLATGGVGCTAACRPARVLPKAALGSRLLPGPRTWRAGRRRGRDSMPRVARPQGHLGTDQDSRDPMPRPRSVCRRRGAQRSRAPPRQPRRWPTTGARSNPRRPPARVRFASTTTALSLSSFSPRESGAGRGGVGAGRRGAWMASRRALHRPSRLSANDRGAVETPCRAPAPARLGSSRIVPSCALPSRVRKVAIEPQRVALSAAATPACAASRPAREGCHRAGDAGPSRGRRAAQVHRVASAQGATPRRLPWG